MGSDWQLAHREDRRLNTKPISPQTSLWRGEMLREPITINSDCFFTVCTIEIPSIPSMGLLPICRGKKNPKVKCVFGNRCLDSSGNICMHSARPSQVSPSSCTAKGHRFSQGGEVRLSVLPQDPETVQSARGEGHQ